MSKKANVVSSGSSESVKFAVAWSENPDGAMAGKEATKAVIDGQGRDVLCLLSGSIVCS
jgi:hypothetical protein